MHDFALKIGYAIINFFTSLSSENLLSALSIMGIGMLGIFIVTGIIILVVALLNKLFSK